MGKKVKKKKSLFILFRFFVTNSRPEKRSHRKEITGPPSKNGRRQLKCLAIRRYLYTMGIKKGKEFVLELAPVGIRQRRCNYCTRGLFIYYTTRKERRETGPCRRPRKRKTPPPYQQWWNVSFWKTLVDPLHLSSSWPPHLSTSLAEVVIPQDSQKTESSIYISLSYI